MFTKVLVANRGEIAVRVIRALDELGVASVAVYSEADRDAPHVRRAGEAHLLGPGPAAESYLAVDRLLAAVERSGAEAVHPGYGFLAENAAFARRLEEAGVGFIGPPAAAIEAMGSKTRARELMQAAGVPIVPGTTAPVETLEAAREAAEEIGYPIAVKAAGGGGGKGFRVALDADELPDAFAGAAREGEKFFADPTVYLERYLPDPRHVEVQVLADAHGTVIHLGERDCSIQRRHQKLIEEAPAPLVDDALRERIGRIATEAARAVGYRGAGTDRGAAGRRGVLLPRDEHPRAGRALRHGGRDRHRHRAGADPRRRPASRCRSARTRWRCAGTPSSAGSTPRTPRAASLPPPARSSATGSPAGRACASTPASRPARRSRRSTTPWWPS